jgi:hypothetical protein
VIICSAPDEASLIRLLRQADRDWLREGGAAPLLGRVVALA